ncbi:cobalamin biosynthesis protein [Actinomycetes bacterium M1A6_2h]
MTTDDVDVAVGIGLRPGAATDDVRRLVHSALLPGWTVAVIATLDRRSQEPAVTELAAEFGVNVLAFDAASLAVVPTVSASSITAIAVGTASVAEAAALLASGAGQLSAVRVKSATVVVAVAAMACRR